MPISTRGLSDYELSRASRAQWVLIAAPPAAHAPGFMLTPASRALNFEENKPYVQSCDG